MFLCNYFTCNFHNIPSNNLGSIFSFTNEMTPTVMKCRIFHSAGEYDAVPLGSMFLILSGFDIFFCVDICRCVVRCR